MTDHSTARMHWIGDPPSAEIIAKVRENIAKELTDLDHSWNLIYHHVSLTKDREGPGVILCGNREILGFSAEYFERLKPMTLDIELLNPEAQEAIRKAQEDDDAS